MRRLINKIHHKLDTVRKYRPTRLKEILAQYEVRLATAEDLEKAKRLHASIYLDRKYVLPDHVKNGIIAAEHDPYQHHSTYFVVVSKTQTNDHHIGEVVAVARQIHMTKDGLGSLPIFEHTKAKMADSVRSGDDYVEISALVKKRGVDSNVLLLLFQRMLKHSEPAGHKAWLMAVDEKVYWRLRTLFPMAIKKIGPKVFYMGSVVVPAKVYLRNIRRNLVLAHLLSPPPFRKLRKELREVLSTR